MPSWTKKDRRMYEHIKESGESRGIETNRAEEVAARTVNKQRRNEGRTPRKRTQGTGNPNQSLEDRTREELYNIAKDENVRGRSKMNKHELAEAIREAR